MERLCLVQDLDPKALRCLEKDNESMPGMHLSRQSKKRCEMEKKLSDLCLKFVHLTNSKSWKDAKTRFPIHTKQEKLEQFLTLKIKKSTPQSFYLFCVM